MMRRLIIHCGKSKTGTSYLQSIFAKNAAKLKEHGVEYPGLSVDLGAAARGEITSGNGIQFASALCRPKDLAPSTTPEAVKSQWLDRCREIEADDILISSELFETVTDEVVTELKSFAEKLDRELWLIAYFRKQEQALQSVYAQGVKRGHVMTGPTEFLEKLNWETFKYSTWLSRMENLVGRDALIACRYVPSQFHRDDLGRDFFYRLGFPENLISEIELASKTINPTPNRTAIQFLRKLNKLKPKMAFSDLANSCCAEWSRLNAAPPRATNDMLMDANVADFDEDGYLIANQDVAEAVREGQATSGKWHFEKFGGNEQRKMVAPKALKQLNEHRDENFLFGLEDVLTIRKFFEYDNSLVIERYFPELSPDVQLFDDIDTSRYLPGRTSDKFDISIEDSMEIILIMMTKMQDRSGA